MARELEHLPILGEKQVARLLAWKPLIDATEAALIEFSAGKVRSLFARSFQCPARTGFLPPCRRSEPRWQ